MLVTILRMDLTLTYSPQAPPTFLFLSKPVWRVQITPQLKIVLFTYISIIHKLTFPWVLCRRQARCTLNADDEYILESNWTASITIWVNKRTKRIEEPTMTVQLFLVLFFETKDDLNGARPGGNFTRLSDNDTRSIPV